MNFNMKWILPVLMLLLCRAAVEVLSAKCMSPDEARYIVPARPVPQKWKTGRWHSGDFFPSPRATSAEDLAPPTVIFLTSQSQGALVWWLKDKDSNLHTIMSQDQSSILCTLHGAGLHVGWKPLTTDAQRSGYCHWNVTEHPHDVTMFQLRNAELAQSLSEIGPVYLNETGLYFDYASNSNNDPANAVDEILTWWKWRNNVDDQGDMTSLPDRCELGPSGYPTFLDGNTELTGRSSGRRRRGRNNFVARVSGPLARCSGRNWFLYGIKCYKLYAKPPLDYARTRKVCKILNGRVALPMNQREQNFIQHLIKSYSRRNAYWIRIQKVDNQLMDDSESERPIGYQKFRRGYRNKWKTNERCVVYAQGSWRPASCETRAGRVLCEREAELLEIPPTCGKIQHKLTDNRMHQMTLNVASDRIIGGKNAYPAQFPWQVAIRFKVPIMVEGYGGKVYHNCGGAIIDKCWILTAAHCFLNNNDKNAYIVRLGDLNNVLDEDSEQEFNIAQLIIHEQYTDLPSHQNDIALVKLEKKGGACASFDSYVQPACLPSAEFAFADDGARCQVSGWGVTNTSLGQASASSILQYVTIPTMRNSICAARYNKRFNYFRGDIMFCAGYKKGGKDSCSGDSGGPYVCRSSSGQYSVNGIVSFGIGCARKNYPGVYTRVSRFLPWISEKIRLYGDHDIIRV